MRILSRSGVTIEVATREPMTADLSLTHLSINTVVRLYPDELLTIAVSATTTR